MDVFLGKVTQQAMTYAIRSGITMTAGFAIKQSARLLKTVEGNEREELQDLQERLDSKIRIISPAIDMIELISARGNTSLESAVTLTKTLRWEIQSLGQRLATAANNEEQIQRRGTKAQDKTRHTQDLKSIVHAIRKLLNRIEDAVPLINLAITASGASLSSSLPATVSPSRLLQASTFLTASDSQYGMLSASAVQVGPTFTLSMYMLFQGHIRPQNEEDVRESTWKEVIHKADVRLMRVPINALYDLPDKLQNPQSSNTSGFASISNVDESLDNSVILPLDASQDVRADEYAYQMVIVEDLEDDRVHSFGDDEAQPEAYGDVPLSGIKEALPIHQLSKIFYADTGKILNIGSEGEANSPVLLLKRDVSAIPPRRMVDRYDSGEPGHSYDRPAGNPDKVSSSNPNSILSDSSNSGPPSASASSNPWRLPQDLDPEWIAFEVYTEADDSDTEVETEVSSPRPSQGSRSTTLDPAMTAGMSSLDMNGAYSTASSPTPNTGSRQPNPQPSLPPIRTSLSLLEMLLRLLSLQQFQQTPHLSIPDELLTFFLSESASTGAASNDAQERKRLREEARRRVGFDPYDESPVKRRGEEYQYRGGADSEQWNADDQSFSERGYSSPIRYEDEGYGTRDWIYPANSRRTSDRTNSTPQTPSLQKEKSRSSTPQNPSSSSGGRPPPVSRWSSSLRSSTAEAARKGSPLARPATGRSDEGLGTSPASDRGIQK